MKKVKSNIRAERLAAQKESLQVISTNCSPKLQRCIELGSEKGSSSWLTVLPLEDYGFHLSKGDFRDALCLRYGTVQMLLREEVRCGSFNDLP